MPNPTPAERARTIVRLSPYLRVRAPGACADVALHGTDPDGSVVLVLTEQSPVVAAVRAERADLPVLLDAADLCPVPVADRLRGRARLVGWVHEPEPLLLHREHAGSATRSLLHDARNLRELRQSIDETAAELGEGIGADATRRAREAAARFGVDTALKLLRYQRDPVGAWNQLRAAAALAGRGFVLRALVEKARPSAHADSAGAAPR